MYSLNFCKFIGMRISLFNSSQGHCLHSSQYFIPLFAAQAFLFSNHFSLALRNFETPHSLTCFILHQTSKNHALDSNVSALKKSKNLHGKLSQSKHKSRFLWHTYRFCSISDILCLSPYCFCSLHTRHRGSQCIHHSKDRKEQRDSNQLLPNFQPQ